MLRDTFKQSFRNRWGGDTVSTYLMLVLRFYTTKEKKIKGDFKTPLVSRDVTEVGLQVGARASPSVIGMSRGSTCRSAVSAC